MKIAKNDNGFVCEWCGKTVSPLGYTSRDHCPYCLVSKHVDILPGDRSNDCGGHLIPYDVEISAKKGYVIHYKCDKCKQTHNNKSATDDKMSVILSLMNKSYNPKDFKK